MIQSESAVRRLVQELRTQIPNLTKLCQAVGYIDMLASLAHIVTVGDYCRPEISSTMVLTSARHPVVEKVRVSQRRGKSLTALVLSL
jgi:DNA mismatch repair protein MSH4